MPGWRNPHVNSVWMRPPPASRTCTRLLRMMLPPSVSPYAEQCVAGFVAELGAQVVDVHIDGLGTDGSLIAVDAGNERAAFEDPVGAREQLAQDTIFVRCQVDGPAVHAATMLGVVKFDGADMEDRVKVGLPGREAAQDGVYTDQKFAR